MYFGTQGMLIWNKHVLKNKANLLQGSFDVSSFIESKYENYLGFGGGKNKANSKPIPKQVRGKFKLKIDFFRVNLRNLCHRYLCLRYPRFAL
jgi:hypothetical protein